MTTISTEGLESSLTDDSSIGETVATLVEIVEDQSERIDELEDRLDDEQTQRGKDDAELRSRVNDVEEDVSDDTNPTPDDEDDASTDTHTPLEQVCALPEEAALSQLSANQRRARFVAKDVEQYASMVPAGYAITSGEISTVLRAGTDSSGRTQTVARVMNFLDRLGGGMVKVVKRRGTKRVIFDEELVQKLSQIESESEPNNASCYPTTGVGV